MKRVLLILCIVFCLWHLQAKGQQVDYSLLGELYRTEGLENDVDSLLSFTKDILLTDFSDAPDDIRDILISMDGHGAMPSDPEIKETIPQMIEYVRRLEKEEPASIRTMISQAELGYLGYRSSVDSLIDYSYKSYLNAAATQRLELLALYYSLDGNRYARSPFIILGDIMLKAEDKQYSLTFYQQAFPLDIVNEQYLGQSTPKSVFQEIRDSYSIPAYKAMYSYPIQMMKLAQADYLSSGQSFALFLNESLRAAAERIFRALISFDSEKFEWLLHLYTPVISYQYLNPDPSWAYDAALFLKGCSNTIASDIRGMYVDEVNLDDWSRHSRPLNMTQEEFELFEKERIRRQYPEERYVDYLVHQQNFKKDPSQINRDKLERAFNRIQNDLILYKGRFKSLMTTYDDISRVLDTDQYAVEFIRVPEWESDDYSYQALLLSGGNEIPQRIPLCSEKELQIVSSLSPSRLYADGSDVLYSIVWKPVMESIPPGSEICYSPDGLLNLLNLDVISDGKTRMNDIYRMRRVSSTRAVAMPEERIAFDDAALYGGLKYDMNDEEMLSQNSRYDGYSRPSRGFDISSDRSGWSDLPGAAEEIIGLSSLLNERGISNRIYSGVEGSEESFKAMSWNSPSVIHLATHGFYYSKGTEIGRQYFSQLLQSGKVTGIMDRSGIVLSGGQAAWLGNTIPEKVEDGILLSNEIMDMDLGKTRMVVLSACETALGDVTPEGVIGLQSAFRKAGVDIVIMSLWKIDDNATKMFMDEFYRYILATGSAMDALKKAQQILCASDYYSDPYYWAGFIATE